jgi:thioredoxin 1
MNKAVIIVVIILGVVIVAGFALFNKKDTTKQSVITPTTEQAEQANNTRYIEYSKAALDEASGNRRVLYFYASWCPTCRPADANFTAQVEQIPPDVTVLRVNYNDPDTDQEEKDLAQKYQITYQHTFVQIDTDGNEVTKWNGGQIEELLANIK